MLHKIPALRWLLIIIMSYFYMLSILMFQEISIAIQKKCVLCMQSSLFLMNLHRINYNMITTHFEYYRLNLVFLTNCKSVPLRHSPLISI